MNPEQLPVILVVTGQSPHTQIAVDQAIACGAIVTVISDRPYKNCRLVDIRGFETLATRFDRLYRHKSTNPESFERAAWRRWFVLAEYMKKQSILRAFSGDGDLFLFESPSAAPHANLTCGFLGCRPLEQKPYEWIVSGHACYWSLDAILEFCDYCYALLEAGDNGLLQEKWEHHQLHNIAGGICDMTALYLYWEHALSRQNTSGNLLEMIEGKVFDLHFGLGANLYSGEFALHRGRKAISRWRNRVPMCKSLRNGCDVQFMSFHFQGHLKRRMPRMRTVARLHLEQLSEYML